MTKQITASHILLASLLSAPSLAEVDTSEWLCESCPFESGYRADYEVGVTSVSDDAARFGNGNGYDEDGSYLNLDGEGHYRSDAYQLDWHLEDLAIASRVAELSGGAQGRYGFYLGYRELPYRLFDTTQTVFSQNAAGVLSLPSSWVPAGSTSGMTQLNSSLRKVGIESDRRIIDAGAHWLAGKQWRLFADYRQQNKEGLDIMAGAGFTQSAQLPRSVDYETDQVDLGIQYLLPRGAVTLAYYGSFFTNNNSALRWQSPFTTFSGASQPQMAQEPDNDFQQVSISGHYRPELWNSVVAVSLASGTGEQNQAFLPYTVNSGISTTALPRAALDGKVDTTNFAIRWTARPSSALRIKAAYRLDDRDNTTAQSEWTRVIVDLVNSGEAEQNLPYSFERTRFNVSAELKLKDDWRVSAGYDYKALDRDFQEVAEQTTDTGWAQLRWDPVSWAELRLRGGSEKREVDRYDTSVAQSFGQNPLLRKYNLAYRYREFYEFAASASLTNTPLSFGLSVYDTDDSYTKSLLGMTSASEQRFNVDVNWAFGENSSMYLVYGSEDIDATQLGSQGFSTPDWEARHADSFDHIGIGFNWRKIADKLDLRLDYTRGNGDSDIAVSTDLNGASPLPDLQSKLDSLRLEAAYRWSERLLITADLRFEQFSADDWALQGVEPDTLPTILTLGADPYDYDVSFVGIGFRYSFGERELALRN